MTWYGLVFSSICISLLFFSCSKAGVSQSNRNSLSSQSDSHDRTTPPDPQIQPPQSPDKGLTVSEANELDEQASAALLSCVGISLYDYWDSDYKVEELKGVFHQKDFEDSGLDPTLAEVSGALQTYLGATEKIQREMTAEDPIFSERLKIRRQIAQALSVWIQKNEDQLSTLFRKFFQECRARGEKPADNPRTEVPALPLPDERRTQGLESIPKEVRQDTPTRIPQEPAAHRVEGDLARKARSVDPVPTFSRPGLAAAKPSAPLYTVKNMANRPPILGNFLLVKVPDDGNCAFTAMGTKREAFIAAAHQALDREGIKGDTYHSLLFAFLEEQTRIEERNRVGDGVDMELEIRMSSIQKNGGISSIKQAHQFLDQIVSLKTFYANGPIIERVSVLFKICVIEVVADPNPYQFNVTSLINCSDKKEVKYLVSEGNHFNALKNVESF